jgi:single-strand DNA-binding protein
MATLTLFGRLGRDAEIRKTQGGDSVCSLAIAYNYGQKDSDGKKPSQWVNASLWGKRADAMAPYLLKGTPLVVTLEDPHVRMFVNNKNGETSASLDGRVLTIEFAGKAPERQPERQAPRAAAPSPAKRGVGFDDIDDDIPF